MGRRIVAGAAVGTALTLSLTGCFGDDEKSSSGTAGSGVQLTAAQVLERTSQKTSQTESFKANLSMDGTTKGQSVKMRGSMQYRTEPLSFSMKFDEMSAGGRAIPGGMQQVFVDNTFYMKMSMFSQLSGSKPWIKISVAETEKKSGMNIQDLLKQSEQLNPVQNTKMLTASKDARQVGKETIDGVETTHYTGTYSLEEALSKVDAKTRDTLGKAYREAGMTKMTFDLWVDGQQLPRKLVLKPVEGAKEQMSITANFSDFGKGVNISAPPASQVTDMKDLKLPGQPGN